MATAKAPSSRSASHTVRLRPIALPAEHGGWGFLLEPIALGLILVPSIPGLMLGLTVIGAYLIRQPMNITLVDRRRGKRYPRTSVAERFALLYAGTVVVGLGAAVALAGPRPLLPLVLASPFMLVFLAHDVRRQGRSLAAELAGPVALSATAASIVLAGEWALAASLALWAILALRAVPAVLYVRSRLRLSRGRPTSVWLPLGAHLLAIGLGVALVAADLLPWLAVLALAVLLARAAICLSALCQDVTPRIVGLTELGLGALTVLLVALGYILGL
jgi:hypothetical protein